MKFKKLVLKNFRQFKGTSEINFSTDNEQNITVIYGGITHGKTTLLQAFNWVLYNKVNLQNPNDLLNYEIADELTHGDTATVSVELYITQEENDLEYRFSRLQNNGITQDRRIVPTSSYCTAEKRENDTWMSLSNFEEAVNNILPHNLSTYFFFDGERMDVISKEQRQGSQEVGNSVKSILGLEHFSTALKHLKGSSGSRSSVIGELRNRLNSDANDEIDKLRRNIDRYEENINLSKNRIEEYELEIEKLESSKKAKEEIISENKDTYKKQQHKIELQNRLSKLEASKLRLEQSFSSYFNNYYLDFFYFGLDSKMKKLYESEILNQTSEAVPNMHQKSIEYILKRGYCLCGQHFSEGDEHYNALIEEMKKLPPQSIGTSIATFKKDANMHISEMKANNFKEEIINRYSSISDNTSEINALKDEIDSLSKDIETNVDVGSLERDVREIEERIKNLSMKKGMEKSSIESNERNKENDADKISRLAQFDAKNQETLREIDYANKITKTIESYYVIRERQLIYKLEKEINKYLQQIYTGERKMKITPDYKFKLVFNDGDEDDSPESEGLGTVKAISFMCGLLDVAKSKILEEVSEETMYPLVFDAPLSKIDSIHRKNVMSCLPGVASQVIIFTREKKDLDDISPETREKISVEYNIEKLSEKNSKVVSEKEGN